MLIKIRNERYSFGKMMQLAMEEVKTEIGMENGTFNAIFIKKII